MKELIEYISKLLEEADKQKKEELDYANTTIEKLDREKKVLAARLKTNKDVAIMVSSCLKKMRDELNEKNEQLSQLQHAQKSNELAKERLKKENALLTEAMENLKRKALADNAEAKTRIQAQDIKIAQLHKQAAASRHRILVLDAELATARKDLEKQAQAYASQESHMKQQLEHMSAELSLPKEFKSRAATKETLNEVAELKQRLDESKKENHALMEKIKQYKMQKINGIQYVDELKKQISQLRKEIEGQKKKESLLEQELERVKKIKPEGRRPLQNLGVNSKQN